MVRVGVLALQGAFREHLSMLGSLGVETLKVTLPEHLTSLDAIVLPGGESSAMVRIAANAGLFEPLSALIHEGLPTFGTCAGLILLANRLTDDSLGGYQRLGGLDITVERNAYGGQLASFVAPLAISGIDGEFPAPFIRAPQIVDAGSAEVLARHEERPVLVRQDRIWAATFHPELSPDSRIHRRFLQEAHLPV